MHVLLQGLSISFPAPKASLDMLPEGGSLFEYQSFYTDLRAIIQLKGSTDYRWHLHDAQINRNLCESIYDKRDKRNLFVCMESEFTQALDHDFLAIID